MKTITVLTCAALLLGLGVRLPAAEPPPLSAAEQARVKATVGGLMDQLSRHAEALDAVKTLAVLSDEPDAVFLFCGKPYTKPQLVRTLTEMYGTLRSLKITMKPPTVTVLGADAAVWTTTGTAVSVNQEGETFTEELHETWVWQRRGGQWRVVHSHECVATPAAPAQK